MLEFNAIMAAGSQISSPSHSHGDNCSSLWLPIDLILEDAMDGQGQVTANSAVEIISGMIIWRILTSLCFQPCVAGIYEIIIIEKGIIELFHKKEYY